MRAQAGLGHQMTRNEIKPQIDRGKLIQLIHIGKTKLGMDQESYEAFLVGLTGKFSCADLDNHELDRVLKYMRQAGFKVQQQRGAKRLPVALSDIAYASPRQVYYIKGLWELASRNPTEIALRHFIHRITGVDDLRFIPKGKVQAVILAIKDITQKAGFNPDCPPAKEKHNDRTCP